MGFLTLVEPKGVLADTIYLEVPNDLTRGMLEQRVRTDILDVLQENALMGGPTNFAVVVNPEIEADPLITEAPENVYPIGSAPSLHTEEYSRKTGAVGLLFDTRLNPKYNFDNFVTGGPTALPTRLPSRSQRPRPRHTTRCLSTAVLGLVRPTFCTPLDTTP